MARSASWQCYMGVPPCDKATAWQCHMVVPHGSTAEGRHRSGGRSVNNERLDLGGAGIDCCSVSALLPSPPPSSFSLLSSLLQLPLRRCIVSVILCTLQFFPYSFFYFILSRVSSSCPRVSLAPLSRSISLFVFCKCIPLLPLSFMLLLVPRHFYLPLSSPPPLPPGVSI